jgi:hypothetical protein
LTAVLGVGDPQVAAGDRLDTGCFGRLVELDQREQVALVGQRDRRHLRARAGVHQFRDADGRVDQRILAVHVEMDETGGHGAA